MFPHVLTTPVSWDDFESDLLADDEVAMPSVILAERNAALRRALASLLRDEGYDVTEVGTARTFMESLSDLFVSGDATRTVIVADANMPGLSAYEDIANSPAATRPYLFCITTRLDDRLVKRARKAGAQEVFDIRWEDDELLAACGRATAVA